MKTKRILTVLFCFLSTLFLAPNASADTMPYEFTFTVRKAEADPMVGVKCYVFNQAGNYLGLSASTDSNGAVVFNLLEGTYRIRVDFLGYQFWSDLYTVSTTLSAEMSIPHQDVMVTVLGVGQEPMPLPGLKVYLFTAAGSYQGQSRMTDQDGHVSFSLPRQSYKVRVDYLGKQFWSEVFSSQDTTVNIPLAEAELTVTGAGAPLSGVKVYVFSATGSYLGISGMTDADGKVVFTLAEGEYRFRGDYQGSQYWSAGEILVAGRVNPVDISTGGGTFTLEIMKSEADPLEGVKCYVFNQAGSYLGLSASTDSNGAVAFNLANGSYKFRVDYLGYQLWSDLYVVPTTLSAQMNIPHQEVIITVLGMSREPLPLPDLKVYLFTEAGSYQGQSELTDGKGQANFSLPRQPYKVRVDYLDKQFWSGVFTWQDTTVTIPMMDAGITVTGADAPLSGVKVYVFSSAGAYLGISGTTDANGNVLFSLAEGEYKLRVDYLGNQYWGDLEAVTGEINPLTISTGGGTFALTVNKTETEPLTGLRCYAFSEGGTYLGISTTCDDAGIAAFDLSDGTYKFRVDYLGYQFWTEAYPVPGLLSGALSIPHQDVKVGVQGLNQGGSEPMQGLKVYLFSASGAYQGQSEVTDVNGEAIFNLPELPYKVRADYLGQQFWADVLPWQDSIITIPLGSSELTISSGVPLSGVKVYVFSAEDSYLGVSGTTDAGGNVTFKLPAGLYRFRADLQGNQYWSSEECLTPGEVTSITIMTAPATQVPDVVGLSQADAETAVNEAGLTLGTTTQQFSDMISAGRVISQTPTAGTSVDVGSAVALIISLGPAPVPTVSISATPPTIRVGNLCSLTWNSTNAESCFIEPGIGPLDVNGSILVSPTVTTTYTVSVTGPGGTVTASLTVTVDDSSLSTAECKLNAVGLESYDEFGRSVSISGDCAIVGAPYHYVGEGGEYAGAAFIFNRVGSSWIQMAELSSSDAQDGDEFGSSVSISGDYAVAGALSHEIGINVGYAGAAYIFQHIDSSWIQVAELTAFDEPQYDDFGCSVAISGDYVIVGAHYRNWGEGAAYVFKREGSLWVEQMKLTPSDPESGAHFGYSVAISGDYAVVGARSKTNRGPDGNDRMMYAGAAYVFKRDGSSWTQEAKLLPSDPKRNANFGESVSISGDDLIVGAPYYDVEGNGEFVYEGAAYIFTREGPVWTERNRLIAGDVQDRANFGTSVAVSGDYAIAGALEDDGDRISKGAAYLFKRTVSSWTQLARLSASDGQEWDEFGSSVAIDGGYVVVGSPYASAGTESGSGEGAAYIYSLEHLMQIPSVSISAEPGAIKIGESSTLSWETTNAEFCSIEPGIGDVGSTGSVAVSPNETITYTITATGPYGTATSTITVTVDIPVPAVSIHANPAIISDGESSTLTWTSMNADSLTIDQGIGSVPPEGSTVVSPSQTTTYTVAASGPYGLGTATVTVTVDWKPDINILEPARQDNLANASFTIKWADNDPDSNATISLYYDTDGSGADGNLIVAGLSEDMDGSGDEYLWDTSEVSEGIYYVYALIDDGIRAPEVAYSSGVVSIDRSPPFTTELKLNSHDIAELDGFGKSVAIDGDYAIVGAAGNGLSGAAYIYNRVGTEWVEHAKLLPNDGVEGDSFGSSVDINGDDAVVAAQYGKAIYVFKRQDSNWSQQAKLTINGDLDLLDQVKISGDHIAVSTWVFYPVRECRIVIFRRSGEAWLQQTILEPTDFEIYFGGNLAIEGDYLLAGITQQFYWGRPFVGVEVYKRDADRWVKQGVLTHSNFSIYDNFGASISMSGDYAIIGAPLSRPGGFYHSGAAYIFRRTAAGWIQETRLLPEDLTQRDLHFGETVDIDGDCVIIGIPFENAQGYVLGATSIFKRIGVAWVRQETIKTRDADYNADFPASIALSGDYAIIGAPYDDVNGDHSGSAFVYHIISLDVSSSPSKILAGGSTTLSWNCINATSVSIDHGIGMVPIQGSLKVSPAETTTYTITATFPWGTYTDSAVVTVAPLEISITSPTQGADIGKAEILVEGTISDVPGFEIGVNVNGVVALVDGSHFVANHVPLDEGQNTLTATAVDTFGHTATAAITVNAEMPSDYVRLTADPESGISPFESTLTIEASFSFTNSSITYTGPGTVQFLSNPDPSQYQVRMTTPGLYAFTVEVTDEENNVFTETVTILVLDAEIVDELLKAKWNSMRNALNAADIPKAMVYIAEGAKDMYLYNFNLLNAYLEEIAAGLRDITMVRLDDKIAEYEMWAQQGGQMYSFYISFVKDQDGIWRILFF